MSKPNRHQPLRLADDLRIHVRSVDVDLEGPSGSCRVPLEGFFELLALFETPTSLAEALAKVPVRGVSDWTERAAIVLRLAKVGALVAPGADGAHRLGFADPTLHARMLHDVQRVDAYVRALREVVKPGDVVIDLGTGSGVLAVVAAQAGARRVYAIEETSIADVAEQVFVRNGVADRVQLVRGHSTRIDLPERADVLVTETLGDDPLGEGMLLWIDDAHKRLLVPGARLIPSEVTIIGQLVDIESGWLPTLDEEATARWKDAYGVELDALLDLHRGATTSALQPASAWSSLPRCSAPFDLETLDLQQRVAPTSEGRVVVDVLRASRRVGVGLGFRARLAPGIELDVGPRGDVGSSWRCTIQAALRRESVQLGQRLTTAYRRDRMRCTLQLDVGSTPPSSPDDAG